MFLYHFKHNDDGVSEPKIHSGVAKDENDLRVNYGYDITIIGVCQFSPLEIFLLEKIEWLEAKVENLENQEESRSFADYFKYEY